MLAACLSVLASVRAHYPPHFVFNATQQRGKTIARKLKDAGSAEHVQFAVPRAHHDAILGALFLVNYVLFVHH